jgi:hypothetical protein
MSSNIIDTSLGSAAMIANARLQNCATRQLHSFVLHQWDVGPRTCTRTSAWPRESTQGAGSHSHLFLWEMWSSKFFSRVVVLVYVPTSSVSQLLSTEASQNSFLSCCSSPHIPSLIPFWSMVLNLFYSLGFQIYIYNLDLNLNFSPCIQLTAYFFHLNVLLSGS